MAGLASMGVQVKYSSTEPNTSAKVVSASTLPNCLSCPSLGGDVEQIDVTCLSDYVKKYIPGLKDYGTLEFKFLFDAQETTSSFTTAKGQEGTSMYYAVQLPAKPGYSFGGAFYFQAIPTAAMDEIAVNDKLTWTLSLSLQSAVEYIEPVQST